MFLLRWLYLNRCTSTLCFKNSLGKSCFFMLRGLGLNKIEKIIYCFFASSQKTSISARVISCRDFPRAWALASK